MFNKDNWENFKKTQPLYAAYAENIARMELKFLSSKSANEAYLNPRFAKFHEIMEQNHILTRTGTLKEDITNFIKSM